MRTHGSPLLATLLLAGCFGEVIEGSGAGDSATETDASATDSASVTVETDDSGDATTTGSGGSETGTTAGSSGAATTEPVSTTDDPATTDDVTTDDATTDDATTEADPCDPAPPYATLRWSKDAELNPPMFLQASTLLPGNPLIAISEVSNQGSITYSFDVACPGTYRIWGLTVDHQQYLENPDTYLVRIDGDDDFLWAYGCQYDEGGMWGWRRLRSYKYPICNTDGVTANLGPGTHTVRFRNLEGKNQFNEIAAIAGIVVANDPNFDPNSLYDPG
ncbi:MAG: hypothetical protein KC636_23970 [Myxococcales bacterium]|nr:hypothetical protein [Myxococcales bacterium]